MATGTTLDLGLLFFVLAGIASAEPERDIAAQVRRIPVRYVGVQT
jgi:hypothetical protein